MEAPMVQKSDWGDEPPSPPPSPSPLGDQDNEEYERIRENPFVATLAEPVSTFSIDVDRAAYANVRRFLVGGQMPPPDAVRVEEMLNYFRYDYAQPQGPHPFSVNLELAECPWNPGHQLLHIGIQGKTVPTADLPPSNLVFLLDVSGSMSDPNKLPLLKESLALLLEGLRPADRVAVVVYAGAAGLVLPSTPASEREAILEAFQKLEAGGSTAGGQGIELAYQVASQNFIPNGNNRVILATDGDFNVGPSSDAQLERLIEQKRQAGVFLTVLGFGMGNYKDSKLEKLSNAGNGNYAYIDNLREAQKTLGTEIWGTLFSIAKDVKIQIEFNPAQVKGYRLIGYENRMLAAEDFDDDTKDAGEIGSGHSVTALYEIIPAGSDEAVPGHTELEYQRREVLPSDDLMKLSLRYKLPGQDQSLLVEAKVKASDARSGSPSENFRWASAVAEFGLLLRRSDFAGNARYPALLERARQSTGFDLEGNRAEFIRLAGIAQDLDSENQEP